MFRIRFSWKDPMFLILVGLLLREAFSFWTGSTYDTEVWIRNAYYVAHGANPYSLMNPVPGLSFAYVNQPLPSVGYLPLWSLMLAGIYQFFTLLPGSNRFVFYFLIKQPPIIGDVLLGQLLAQAVVRWGGTPAASRRVLGFWMLFPYPILIGAIWGQFDSLVAMLWVASLLWTRPVKRSILEGLGILLKFFPVIFIPYQFLSDRGIVRWRQLIVLAVPALFTVAVFGLTGWGLGNFQGTVVSQAHGSYAGLTLTAIVFSPGALAAFPQLVSFLGIVAWLWVPAVGLAGVYAALRFPRAREAAEVQALVFITVVFFLFHTQVYEQYLLYLLPLLLLDVAIWHPERRALFHMTWALGLVYLLFNNDFLIRFVSPVSTAAFTLSTALDASPGFGTARAVILDAIAILFALHMVQIALVLVNDRRDARPWLLRVVPGLRSPRAAAVSDERGLPEDVVR